MIDAPGLFAGVERAFVATSGDLATWPDPHPDRCVPEDASSRVTDPRRWRILAARTDAWLAALCAAGLATVEHDAAITWRSDPGPAISRSERVVPAAAGAVELVVAHSQIGDILDAGVVLGAGRPAEVVNRFPDCGCDACDSGSQNELDHLDTHIAAIVTGAFRRLSSGRRTITVLGPDSWSAANLVTSSARDARRQIESVLADPSGWNDTQGSSWLGPTG